jgi:hypothetical protein
MKRLAIVMVVMLGAVGGLSASANAQRAGYAYPGYGYSRTYPTYRYGDPYYDYNLYRYRDQRYSTHYSPYYNNFPRYGSSWGTFPGYPWYRSPTQRFLNQY